VVLDALELGDRRQEPDALAERPRPEEGTRAFADDAPVPGAVGGMELRRADPILRAGRLRLGQVAASGW
jgi:hypothetical protein